MKLKGGSPDSKSSEMDNDTESQEVDTKTGVSDANDEASELLFYFKQIPVDERKIILTQMAEHSEIKYESKEDEESSMKKLFKAFMEDKKEKEDNAATTKFSSTPSPLAFPTSYSKSGLEINPVSRKIGDLESTKVILFKHERGDDPIAKKKTRDKVVKAIDPKLSTNNISRIITSADAASFDVAADALSWQAHLKNIRRFCLQYDMLSLLNIPKGVDYSNPLNVVRHTEYKDAIENWQDLDDGDYFKWQEFILCYSSVTEIESDAWLDDTLHLSMETTLKAEVDSDISSIPLQQRGSITTLRCIIKRMVIKNQESRDALESYVKNFDITKFPGENVPIACLRLKAVARALGNDDLPKNIIRTVLDGFSKSSTKSFNDVCASQLALRRGSLVQALTKTTTLYSQLVDLLGDLETTYLELVGGQKWEGIVHHHHEASFKAVQDRKYDKKSLRNGMSWDEWVKKYAKCIHCGEMGHIRPTCPKYLAQIESGEIQRPIKTPTRDNQRDVRKPAGQRYKVQDRKAKALLSVFQAFYGGNSDSENDDDEAGQDEKEEREQENVDNHDDDELHGFLSMIGSSLKD